jgi:uncharacterized membrane protein
MEILALNANMLFRTALFVVVPPIVSFVILIPIRVLTTELVFVTMVWSMFRDCVLFLGVAALTDSALRLFVSAVTLLLTSTFKTIIVSVRQVTSKSVQFAQLFVGMGEL